MITYEPRIIYQFADRLYRKANSIVAQYCLLGLGIGALADFVLAVVLSTRGNKTPPSGFTLLLLVVVSSVGGYFVGKEKAFAIKLQAQTALVMVKIEENTRAMLAAATPADPGPAGYRDSAS